MLPRSLCAAIRTLSSTTMPVKTTGRTRVILLHHGQPRTQFYAKEFVAKSASLFYRVPVPITKLLVETAWSSFSTLQKSVDTQGESDSGALGVAVRNLAAEVQTSLDALLPEFQPFDVSTAFLFQAPTITETLEGVIRPGIDRVILLPLYPHFSCWKSGAVLNAAAGFLHKRTVRSSRDGTRLDESLRADIRGSSAHFRVSTVHRWNTHPVLVQLWAKRIRESLKGQDAILFVAPIQRGYGSYDYERSVWATSERIAEAVRGAEGEEGSVEGARSLPWLQAWYNSWDSWPLPGGCSRPSISSQLKRLRENGAQRVLVVPATHFLPDAHFDLLTVVPQLLANEEKVSLLTPSSSSRVLLVHGLSELVKNHLLGRDDAQLRLYCKNCRLKECEATRLLLTSASSR